MSRKTIKVDYLARVEGEGGLYIKFKGDAVDEVRLKIFEPPRFFEAFLRGRQFTEAPDITARICGICPIAYQMSACHAMENALGVQVGGALRELRRLIYCGEWIESHGLHVFMLHAPDFLGYQDAIQMAKDHPEIVRNALEIKKTGNRIVSTVGGREIHPVNVRVGGFYRAPTKKELLELVPDLEHCLALSREALKWSTGLSYPDFEPDYEFVALRHENEYPFNEGRLVSNRGLDIDVSDFESHFHEVYVERSNALHCVCTDTNTPYFVGPLARYSLNFDRLSRSVQEAALSAGLQPTCRNPFRSLQVRLVEIIFAFEEALRIIKNYEPPAKPCVELTARAGVGRAITEAPRGILYHRYRLDEQANIQEAKIVPPTSQNQGQIEFDLRQYVSDFSRLSDEELTWQCEQAVRNYDPCISCATHFLKLEVERT